MANLTITEMVGELMDAFYKSQEKQLTDRDLSQIDLEQKEKTLNNLTRDTLGALSASMAVAEVFGQALARSEYTADSGVILKREDWVTVSTLVSLACQLMADIPGLTEMSPLIDSFKPGTEKGDANFILAYEFRDENKGNKSMSFVNGNRAKLAMMIEDIQSENEGLSNACSVAKLVRVLAQTNQLLKDEELSKLMALGVEEGMGSFMGNLVLAINEHGPGSEEVTFAVRELLHSHRGTLERIKQDNTPQPTHEEMSAALADKMRSLGVTIPNASKSLN